MIRALNPKILTPEDSSYKTVKELNEVIEEALKNTLYSCWSIWLR